MANLIRSVGRLCIIVLSLTLFSTATYASIWHDPSVTHAKKADVKKVSLQFYHSVDATYANLTLNISPALLPADYVMPEQKPSYPVPANAPKYDNRVNSFAQLWRDSNLQQKIMRS